MEDVLAASRIEGSLEDEGMPRFPSREHVQENNHLFDHFLASAKREPFYSHARELRDAIKAESEKERSENPEQPFPTEEDDRRSVDRSRLRFTELVKEKGSPEQRQLWSKLCRDSREEYVYRIWVTPLLGGIYAKTASYCAAEERYDNTRREDLRFRFMP